MTEVDQQFPGDRRVRAAGRVTKGQGETIRADDMAIIILMVVVVSQMCTCVKLYQWCNLLM